MNTTSHTVVLDTLLRRPINLSGRSPAVSDEERRLYVDHRMRTISLCVLGLPVCEFVAVPARMRTGAPRMHTVIGFGQMRLSHERKGVRTWGKEQVGM